MADTSTFGYARADDGAYIGYRVDGDGPIDIANQPDFPGNIDLDWQYPVYGHFLRRLSSFARLITHDHRGVGLSSRNVDPPTLETRVSDLLAVLRATGARHPVLSGFHAPGSVNVLLAATRPTLPRAIVWMEPHPRSGWAPDYPWGRTQEERELEQEFIQIWGSDAYGRAFWEAEEALGDRQPREAARQIAIQSRNACTPDVAARITDIWYEIDVREVLGAVQTPTLLLVHADREGAVERAEYIASRMSAAQVRVMPGDGWTVEEVPMWTEEIREFVGVDRTEELADTVLSTILFTDIVGSTERQSALGDHAWKDLIQRHHAIVREALRRWHGVEVDTAGDGFYATFDGPARAIRYALDVNKRIRELGIEIRAGVHTGECEIVDGKCTGIAVSIGAPVASTAGPSEVRVSQAVKDLVAGSGLTFDDAGGHELKGVPGRWRLYAVVSG